MHACAAGLHGRTGAIVARRAAIRDVTAALSFAHERMSRTTGHRSGAAGPMAIKTDRSHCTAKAFSRSPATSHSILKMLMTLSLRAHRRRRNQAGSRRHELAVTSLVHTTRPPRRRARWPLSCRALDNQIERTDEISPERSTRCADAGAAFLDDNAAVLAAIVDLSAARKRFDAVVATFSDRAYDQDASDRGVKGETAKQHRVKLRRFSEGRLKVTAYSSVPIATVEVYEGRADAAPRRADSRRASCSLTH